MSVVVSIKACKTCGREKVDDGMFSGEEWNEWLSCLVCDLEMPAEKADAILSIEDVDLVRVPLVLDESTWGPLPPF